MCKSYLLQIPQGLSHNFTNDEMKKRFTVDCDAPYEHDVIQRRRLTVVSQQQYYRIDALQTQTIFS